ncbi:MAG TPA: PAS domain S-box protein [Pelobium sp.]
MDFEIEKEIAELTKSITILGVWDLSVTSNKLTWSDAAFQMFGYQAQEFEPTMDTVLNMLHHEDKKVFLDAISAAVKQGLAFQLKSRFVCKNGETISVLTKTKVLKDKNGGAVNLLGVFQDVSYLSELENNYQTAIHQLKQKSEFIETIIQNLPIGIAVNKISTGEATIINQAFCEIYGWHRREIKNLMEFFESVYPDEAYRKQLIERIYSDIQSGDPKRMHWENIEVNNANTEKRIVNAKNIPLVHQDLMISTVVDITESVNLAKKQGYLFQKNPAIMLVFDLKTLQIIACNEVAQKKYGYTEQEFCALNLKDVAEFTGTNFFDKCRSGVSANEDKEKWKQITKSGATFWASVSGCYIDYDKRECLLVQLTDITEKIAVQNALKESESQYKQLFEDNPAPMIIWDFETKQIVDCNIEALNLYGYNRAEFLKLSILDIRPPEEIEAIKKSTATEKSYGNIHKNIWRHKKKNGEIMFINLTGHLINYNNRKCSLVMLEDVTKQQDYENNIEESNQRFEYVTNATSDAIWDWDLSNQTVYWGRGFYQLFGYSPQNEHNSINFWIKNVHPDDFAKVKGKLYNAIDSSETNWNSEYRFKHANGNYAYVTDQGFIIRNKEGKAIRMVGSMRDITQKNREVERLKLLESVITHTNDAVLITEAEPFDLPGPRIVYVNEAFTRMTGYSAEEVVGKSPRILQGPLSDQKELRKLGDALRRWETHEITTINYKKNGEPFWINFTVTPVANKKGWYTHWIAIERDVTQQKNNEENLKKALTEKNEILESIGDGFFAINQEWTVTYWNKQVEQMLGISKERIIGEYLWNVFPDGVDSETYIKYHEAMETQDLVRFEHYFELLNKWYEITIYPSNSGLSVYLKDISDKVNYTQAIEQKNKKLKEIAYTQSHVVRAPLARILGLTNLLSELEFKTKDSADLLKYLNNATAELDQVIKEIVNKTEDL